MYIYWVGPYVHKRNIRSTVTISCISIMVLKRDYIWWIISKWVDKPTMRRRNAPNERRKYTIWSRLSCMIYDSYEVSRRNQICYGPGYWNIGSNTDLLDTNSAMNGKPAKGQIKAAIDRILNDFLLISRSLSFCFKPFWQYVSHFSGNSHITQKSPREQRRSPGPFRTTHLYRYIARYQTYLPMLSMAAFTNMV